MAHRLTSWKEIAIYLGKGVRTVQRWERDLGLPVRRFDGRAERRVLALCEELDEWVVSRHAQNGGGIRAELAKCRLELTELNTENERLRREVELLKATLSELHRKLPRNCDPILRARQLMERSAMIQQEGREIIDLSRNLKLLHSKDGSPSTSRFVHLDSPSIDRLKK